MGLQPTLHSVRFILENQCDFGRIAQLVEHLAVNQDVEGSSPSPSSMNCGITLRSMPGVPVATGTLLMRGVAMVACQSHNLAIQVQLFGPATMKKHCQLNTIESLSAVSRFEPTNNFPCRRKSLILTNADSDVDDADDYEKDRKQVFVGNHGDHLPPTPFGSGPGAKPPILGRQKK